MNTDLLIIGGGPAGLNAAYQAASNGIKTTIIDKWFTLGNQLKSQTQVYKNLPKNYPEQRGFELADFLVKRLKGLDVTILTNHTMVGVYKDGNVGITDGSQTFPIEAKKVIVSTGAMEEPEIFPGWTLPGVMTAGAAQKLVNRDRVFPGSKALVLGSNDFALETAYLLYTCGIKVEGIIENESKLRCQNTDLVEKLDSADIPILLNSYIERATGRGEVEEVCVNAKGHKSFYNVDLICIAKGMTPIIEPFEVMSCEFTYQEKLGGWLPKYDHTFKTTNPFVYIAGNAGGITNIGEILLTAEIAAVGVMESLNIKDSKYIEETREYLWQELHRIESIDNDAGFNARLNIIKEFHHETGTPAPSYLTTDSGGMVNG